MSASDERAVAKLAADMLTQLTPVGTVNDGTRDYTWRPANGYFVLLGTEPTDANTWLIDPSSGGDASVVNFLEVVADVVTGHWKFRREGDIWNLIEDNPEGSLSVPPEIPDSFEFFEAISLISGIEQIALAGDDADLKLPAIVVRATFEEEARALKKNGHYGGRYRVDIELRGIRTKPGTDSLDTMLHEIETAMDSKPDPVPASAAVFSYFLVDERLSIENKTGEETRELNRSYSVFALLT